MQIHVNTGDSQHQVIDLTTLNADILQGKLSPDTLAWFEGCEDWVPLHSVPGIVVNRPSTPPPIPSQKAATYATIPVPPAPPVIQQGDVTGGVIPYKNKHALLAYYFGIFGLVPILGILLAIPAVILGISGLKKKKKDPIIKGSAHAWAGIILGALSISYNLLIIGFLVLLAFQ